MTAAMRQPGPIAPTDRARARRRRGVLSSAALAATAGAVLAAGAALAQRSGIGPGAAQPVAVPGLATGVLIWTGDPGQPSRLDLLTAQQSASEKVRKCVVVPHAAQSPHRFPIAVAFSSHGAVVWSTADAGTDTMSRCLSAAVRGMISTPHRMSHPVLVFFPLSGTAWAPAAPSP